MSADHTMDLGSLAKGQEKVVEVMEKLIAVAQPASVFGQPTTAGEYTIITASEASLGVGFGMGMGGGSGSNPTQSAEQDVNVEGVGIGSGGGGGGGAMARPVAVISIGPNGVEIEPIVDATKIAIAMFTALGAMFLSFRRMRRAGRCC
jgi:uncharacterized spore protein YtfJ